ncbi:MAG: hypothetical protein KDA41_12645 [Planctomycetales bacterium]|nr:hypothetical protein [Planctomycetales bacterium]
MPKSVPILFATVSLALAGVAGWHCATTAGARDADVARSSVPNVQGGDGRSDWPSASQSIEQLRAIVADAKREPTARAQAICLIAEARDWESVDLLIAQLEDSSPLVRGRAGVALQHILGTDFLYRAESPPAQRAAAIRGLRRYWESRKAYPPLTE